MANLNTSIEWTDATWSPVTGCTKVSTGCKHCYAERLFPRVYGKDTVLYHPNTMNPGTRPRKFTDVKLHPERLEQPLHWKKPRMIFVNSMSDLFHEDVPFEFIDKIFAVMALTKRHTFQILTKRPERMLEYLTINDLWAHKVLPEIDKLHSAYGSPVEYIWPLRNVWLGISCENQATADERIPVLLQVPAAVRFLSCEPLLDEINLSRYLGKSMYCDRHGFVSYIKWTTMKTCGLCMEEMSCAAGSATSLRRELSHLDWIIIGGESGPNYRPMNLDWAYSIGNQCQEADVPFFFKQTAGKKEIPEDLQVREFPI